MKKIIKFLTVSQEFNIPIPKPSKMFLSKWYKNIPPVNSGILTVKKCVPFLDAMTAGYTIVLAADVEWDGNGFIDKTVVEIISKHNSLQLGNFEVPTEFITQPFKWKNFFITKTPKGYSTLFVHPLNRLDLPFYCFSGIVDTDNYPAPVNFPFVMKENFVGVIPAGTPIIQAIPFKRTEWKSQNGNADNDKVDLETSTIFNPPFGTYKRKWWSRKKYE